MAFLSIPKVAIRGISACVPANIEENRDLQLFKEGEAERVIAQTGIERRHVITDGMTTSDLCVKAFEKLIEELGWERSSIDALYFGTLSPDYLIPPTSCILQHELGLSESCLCVDIRQGCPGWVVGLSNIMSIVSLGNIKRAVFLCGDSSTYLNSPKDKETRPLFSDAGTATAIEYDVNAAKVEFYFGTRGKDFQAIFTPDGGMRSPITENSLKYIEYGTNRLRRGIDCIMDGMNVFSFGLSTAPKAFHTLCEYFNINIEDIDYYVFHQANKYMNEKIRKKLNLEIEKVPYSLKDYGNASCASIPLTLVTQCREKLQNMNLNMIACAFGVGLSWACVHFMTKQIVCPELQLL